MVWGGTPEAPASHWSLRLAGESGPPPRGAIERPYLL